MKYLIIKDLSGLTEAPPEAAIMLFWGQNKSQVIPMDIIWSACEAMGTTYNEIKNKSRKQHLVYSRAVIFWKLRKETTLPFAIIGGLFNQDHSTAMYHARNVEIVDRRFNPKLFELKQKILQIKPK